LSTQFQNSLIDPAADAYQEEARALLQFRNRLPYKIPLSFPYSIANGALSAISEVIEI